MLLGAHGLHYNGLILLGQEKSNDRMNVGFEERSQ